MVRSSREKPNSRLRKLYEVTKSDKIRKIVVLKNRRVDIQFLRAFSVIVVVIFHARESFMPNGYLGVDLFFLISGFVLTPQIIQLFLSPRKSLRQKCCQFIKRRAFRLLPAFCISIIICTLIVTLFGPISKVYSALIQSMWSLLFMGNFGAEQLSGNYFNPTPNPFLHFWSLSAEWQIYLGVPILITVIAVIDRNRKISYSLFLVSLLITSIIFTNFLSDLSSSSSYYSPIIRVWQFAAGSLFYLYFAEKNFSKSANTIGKVILIVSILTLISSVQLNRAQANILVIVLFSSLLFSDLKITNILGKILLWTGDRSYSIYLYHLPLIFLALYSPLSAAETNLRLLGVVLAIGVTIFIADFSYKQFERTWTVDRRILDRKLILSYSASWILVVSIFASLIVLPVYSQKERTSVSWNSSPKCINSIEKVCSVNPIPNPKARVIVVGDSHSQHYFSSFKEFGNTQKIEFLYLRQVDIEAIAVNRPALIILSSHHSSLQAETFNDYRRNLQLIARLRIPILYISDNPTFVDHMEYTHYIQPSIVSLLLEELGFLTAPAVQVPRFNLQIEATLARRIYSEEASKVAKVFDTFLVLCDKGKCARKIDNEWLYWDDHHLSEFGAKVVFDEFSKEISRALDFK